MKTWRVLLAWSDESTIVAMRTDGWMCSTAAFQQHVLTGTRGKDGGPVSLTAALVARVRDGKIVRIDDYIDSAEVATFVA